MNLLSLARIGALAVAALLASCGGGQDSGPAVSTLSATNVAYGRTVSVTVLGTGLNANLTAAIEPGCFTMARTASSSDTSQTFTCKIAALGDLRVRVRTAEGAELASLRLTVEAPRVSMTVKQGTNEGSFVMELDPTKAPKTVDNFLAYVNTGTTCTFYKDTLFHRVIQGFVAQGGGYTASLTKKTALAPIELESNNGLQNLKYTVAMARTDAPNSATSEFFVNVADNPALDYAGSASPGYAVFGKVISGTEVIDVLQAVPTMTKKNETTQQEFPDAPIDNVVISACSQVR